MKSNFHTRQQLDKAYRQGFKNGVRSCMEDILATVTLALQDKHGWNKEDLHVLETEVNGTFDSVIKGYVSFDEIYEAKIEEIG